MGTVKRDVIDVSKSAEVRNLPVCANARWGNIFELGEIFGKLLSIKCFCMENHGEKFFLIIITTRTSSAI